MITEVNKIEIHESQNNTPTNYHKLCKSKSRAEKYNSHSIRPSNAIRSNEITTQSKNSIRTVPGN